MSHVSNGTFKNVLDRLLRPKPYRPFIAEIDFKRHREIVIVSSRPLILVPPLRRR